MRLPRAYGRRFGETSQILAHRYAIFLCSWDVEIDDSLVGQLTRNVWDMDSMVCETLVLVLARDNTM